MSIQTYLLQDIYPEEEIKLFHEDSSLDDVDQGVFGTCYLLAVLSGLAAIPKAIRLVSTNSMKTFQSLSCPSLQECEIIFLADITSRCLQSEERNLPLSVLAVWALV